MLARSLTLRPLIETSVMRGVFGAARLVRASAGRPGTYRERHRDRDHLPVSDESGAGASLTLTARPRCLSKATSS